MATSLVRSEGLRHLLALAVLGAAVFACFRLLSPAPSSPALPLPVAAPPRPVSVTIPESVVPHAPSAALRQAFRAARASAPGR